MQPLLVHQVRREAEGVLSLRLVDPDGSPLPAWTPGAHVDVALPSGLVRQYSLCGDPDAGDAYTIAVLREAAGRGGSREIHESAREGRTLPVGMPRNRFPLVDAPRYLFIAGGIGITPILAMAREATRRGVPWHLMYGGRTRSSMAFVGELESLGRENIELLPQDEVGMPDLDSILRGTPEDNAVYCCGPEGLIAAAESACDVHLPPGALHVERFSPAKPTSADPPEETATSPATFEVELRRTGHVLSVPPDRSLLDVVRDAVPAAPSSCEEGFCGVCETTVLDGAPEHNDEVLTDDERERSETMLICVGRSKSPRLVLDL